MNDLTDREFAEWLDAIERNEDIPASLPAEDAADLRLAQRLLDHRVVSPPVRLKSARYQRPISNGRRLWQWQLATLALLGILLLGVAVVTSRAEVWVTPEIVVFEGERYDLEVFKELVEEEGLKGDMILFLDEDENGQQVFYAFRNLEAAQPFMKER